MLKMTVFDDESTMNVVIDIPVQFALAPMLIPNPLKSSGKISPKYMQGIGPTCRGANEERTRSEATS